MDVHLQFGMSQRGKGVLQHLGHEYLIKSGAIGSDEITWRCRQYRKYSCPARLRTQNGNIVWGPTEHCHSGDAVQLQVNSILTRIKTESMSSTASPRNIIQNSLLGVPDDVIARLPKKDSIKRGMNRRRTRVCDPYEPNPTTLDFDIPERYHDIVLFDSGPATGESRIIVLGLNDMLHRLEGELLMVDGTYTTVPALQFQLHTVHAKVGNHVPPIIYFLIQNRSQETYNNMLNILRMLVPNVNPANILLNFERPMITSFESAFPSSVVSSCFLHFFHHVIDKVKELNLKNRFEGDSEFGMMVKSLCALAFVPVEDVETAFDLLATNFTDDDESIQLLLYFESAFIRRRIGGTIRPPLYELNFWNNYADALVMGDPKATLANQIFHSTLESLFLMYNPSLWKLFEGLKKDMSTHALTSQQAEMGNYKKDNNKNIRMAEELVKRVFGYGQESDKLLYLRSIANLQ